MSDIGLFPPSAMAWFCSLALLAFAGLALVVCLFIAWLRTRSPTQRLTADRFFGYALGAIAMALASEFSLWLINDSGSLGAFSHWIDHTATTAGWILAIFLLWPAVAFAWNRAHKIAAPVV